MIRRPPRSTLDRSSAASDVYKRQNTSKAHHFGSRIEFDDNGYLYFTIGDRGDHFENPQDITKDGGKVYYDLFQKGQIKPEIILSLIHISEPTRPY